MTIKHTKSMIDSPRVEKRFKELLEIMARTQCKIVEEDSNLEYPNAIANSREEFVEKAWRNYVPQIEESLKVAFVQKRLQWR